MIEKKVLPCLGSFSVFRSPCSLTVWPFPFHGLMQSGTAKRMSSSQPYTFSDLVLSLFSKIFFPFPRAISSFRATFSNALPSLLLADASVQSSSLSCYFAHFPPTEGSLLFCKGDEKPPFPFFHLSPFFFRTPFHPVPPIFSRFPPPE